MLVGSAGLFWLAGLRRRRLAYRCAGLVLVGAVVVTGAVGAAASDGVLEINQACALNGGCFPGDTSGFPVTITSTAPGSNFRLTGDLVVPVGPQSGIRINMTTSGEPVEIDLGGFSLLGPNECSGFPVVCSLTNASLEGCTLASNGSDGIQVSVSSSSRQGGIVVRNTVDQTNGIGIASGAGALVVDNQVVDTGSIGISVGAGAVVRGNVVRGAESHGVSADDASLVEGNAVRGNGGAGLVVGNHSLVRRNTAYSNTGVGLALGSGTGYSDNVIANNSAGTVTGGTEFGVNMCDGAIGCP